MGLALALALAPALALALALLEGTKGVPKSGVRK